MANFQIKGTQYQSGVIVGGNEQAFVLKRILPVIAAFTEAYPAIRAAQVEAMPDGEPRSDEAIEQAKKNFDLSVIGTALMPVAKALASLPDQDLEYVTNACLDVTSRKTAQGVGWMPVRKNGVINDKTDDNLVVRMACAWYVIAETYADVLPDLEFIPQPKT